MLGYLLVSAPKRLLNKPKIVADPTCRRFAT